MNTTPFTTQHITAPAGGSRCGQGQPVAVTGRAGRQRALVLGGGGSAGNAWLIGVIAGLVETGLELTEADLIIGTSAGATTAAQIVSVSPAQLLADILAAAPRRPTGSGARIGPVADHLSRTGEIIAAADGPADMRRRMGAAALELDAGSDGSDGSDGSGQARWRAVVAARLPSQQWPHRALLITAVDAATGEPVVFDRHSGVDLVDAVAASTANGFGVPPFGISGRRYIDGGYRRSSENADLAAGYKRVLVLSPFSGRTRHPLEWGMQLAVQIEELRAGGSSVETIFPDREALVAFGDNMMDLSARPAAAQAGYYQGRSGAEQLIGFWG